MRIRHCVARAVLRQPWQFDDEETLTRALEGLVIDVLLRRLDAQLDRIQQADPLGHMVLQVRLPANVVLAVASSGSTGSQERRLPSFAAEVAVHDAVSDAVRAAVEEVAHAEAGREGVSRPWPGEHRPLPPGADAPRVAERPSVATRPISGSAALPAAESIRSGLRDGRPDGDLPRRRRAAIDHTLLAAVRCGRLVALLGNAHPALLLEWARALAGEPRPGAAAPATGSAPPPRVAARGAPTVAGAALPGLAGGKPTSGPVGCPPPTAGSTPASTDIGVAAAAHGSPASGPVGRPTPDADTAPVSAGTEVPAAVDASVATWENSVSPPHPGQFAVSAAQPGPSFSDLRNHPHDDRRRPSAAQPADADAVSAAVEAAVAGLGDTQAAAARLEAAAVSAHRLGLSPSDDRIQRALDRLLPTPPEQALAPVPPHSPGPTWGPQSAGPPAGGAHEREVASVLPFLLLGPLDDLGLLDAVAAGLPESGGSGLLSAFAAGLARKVLPPPARGWQATGQEAAAVAAFTGQDDPPEGDRADDLERTMRIWWPPVEQTLEGTLAGLHSPGSPLAVVPSSLGFVVADTEGVLPLAWGADPEAVQRLWTSTGCPPLLGDAALARTLPGELPAAVNDGAAEALADLVGLLDERPASGRTDLARALNAPLGLLVGVALAILAWELWHEHELSHPALALLRLGDLDGRVRLEPDLVTVRLPLGRRHADLSAAGLLRPVDRVPWLGGRSVELLGG
jgi:hypothetical protein